METKKSAGIDKIIQIQIQGFKSLEDVTLDLNGLKVLIGENGAGKSSIIEALEILRLTSQTVAITREVIGLNHGNLRELITIPKTKFGIRAQIEMYDTKDVVEYYIEFGIVSGSTSILHEQAIYVKNNTQNENLLKESVSPNKLIFTRQERTIRATEEAVIYKFHQEADYFVFDVDEANTALSKFGYLSETSEILKRVIKAVGSIYHFLHVENRPRWQRNQLNHGKNARDNNPAEPAEKLDRYGVNLTALLNNLQNKPIHAETWNLFKSRAKLVLGENLENISVEIASRNVLETKFYFSGQYDNPQTLEQLSDGQVEYIAYLAMILTTVDSSLVLIDELELHLHPLLVGNVTGMLQDFSENTNVLVSTHSDVILNALENPARSAVLLELDQHRHTKLLYLEEEKLKKWLDNYSGLGEIRNAGYAPLVFNEKGT